MKKKLMLIINPVAGRAGFRGKLGAILEVFHKGGYQTSVFFTDGPMDAANLVAENAPGFDLVGCIGGDGTLSEVVTGMMELNNAPPLGYIPMGTANDVARTLGLPKSAVKAAQRMVSGVPAPIDVGDFGGKGYFTYIAAFGALSEVSYATPQDVKQTIGHFAYVLEGVRNLSGINSYHAVVSHDGGVLDDDFVFGAVINSTSIAGLLRLDDSIVDLRDGLLELLLIRNPTSLLELNQIIADMLSQNFRSNNIELLQSKEISFRFDKEVAWTRDGENGGMHSEITLTNRHLALNIVV